MLTVVQRVSEAHVSIEGKTTASIQKGLLILCGFEPGDTQETLRRMLEKCMHMRVFEDALGKMNLSLEAIQGDLLLIPQFTLMADTKKGLRPGFSRAAPPELGQRLFNDLMMLSQELYPKTLGGSFGANMQVYLCNDGPATFLVEF